MALTTPTRPASSEIKQIGLALDHENPDAKKQPAEFGSLSSISQDDSRFNTGTCGEAVLKETENESGVAVGGVLFSRLRYGQFCIVVRGQDVGRCDFCSWQQDLPVLELALIGHAMAGQMVAILTSIRTIMNAAAVLIIEVDVPNRILVGSILRAPKDQRNKTAVPALATG